MIKNKETIKVTLVKSIIGTKKSHKATVYGLGLRKLNSSVELASTPETLGMIKKISYLIKID
jgi:large subunit ribosomal protein L30